MSEKRAKSIFLQLWFECMQVFVVVIHKNVLVSWFLLNIWTKFRKPVRILGKNNKKKKVKVVLCMFGC